MYFFELTEQVSPAPYPENGRRSGFLPLLIGRKLSGCDQAKTIGVNSSSIIQTLIAYKSPGDLVNI